MADSSSGRLDFWDAEKMLDLYVHDYMMKNNMHKTAEIFRKEADVYTGSPVVIDSKEGFLNEWWNVFYEMYSSRTSELKPQEAKAEAAAPVQERRENEQQQQQQQCKYDRVPEDLPKVPTVPLPITKQKRSRRTPRARTTDYFSKWLGIPDADLSRRSHPLSVNNLNISKSSASSSSPLHQQLLKNIAQMQMQDNRKWISFGKTNNTGSKVSGMHNSLLPQTVAHDSGTSGVKPGPKIGRPSKVVSSDVQAPNQQKLIETSREEQQQPPLGDQDMDAHGRISSEAALNKKGRVVGKKIEYTRSQSLSSIHVDLPPQDKVTLVARVEMNSGYLTFHQDSEDQVIKTTRNFSNVFKGHTLEKVNNDPEGALFSFDENFYPILYKMLNTKQDWTPNLCFRGRATFEVGVMEWTEFILTNFKDVLNQSGIYGAVGVSRYPYQHCTSTWKAFLELWSPLTNTLHHGNGEMSISLYDLKAIGGLPISGIPYEEFIPENKALQRAGLYSSILSELLCVHSQLCVASKQKFVRWEDWVKHFYRGELLYTAYGEDTQCINPLQCEKFMESRSFLTVSKEGQLAAFLAYWLSRFVLPSYCFKIRPETFHMACLMAQGIKVSLAPVALGHIYHGLGEIVTDPRGPGESRGCFPVHYVIGWLGEHFNCLYRRHADSEFPENYPHLSRYAGIKAQQLDITTARLVFRTGGSVEYRPTPFVESEGFLIDDGKLSEERLDWLISLRSALLPVRIGDELWLEPYYPNRFARQFGFDQGVPANRLQLKVEKRKKCGVEALARAQRILYRVGTGIRFYIPRSSYEGLCTWTYCRWWMAACAPYLGRSVSFVYTTLKKRPLERQSNIFVIRSLRDISTAMPKEVFFSDFNEGDPAASMNTSPITCRGGGMNRKKHGAYSGDDERSNKRARHTRHDGLKADVAEKLVSPPKGHASKTGWVPSNDGIVTPKLKSVIVRDQTFKPQNLRPTLQGRRSELKQVEPKCKDSGSKSHDSLNTLERVEKGPEPELPVLEPESVGLACEPIPSDCDEEMPLIEAEPRVEPPLLLLEWHRTSELKGSDLPMEDFVLTEEHSDSNSRDTEPIDPDLCENVDEDLCHQNNTSAVLREVFNSSLNARWGAFIITEIEDILSKISLSQPIWCITERCSEVQRSIEMLRPVIKTYGSGEDRFERFAESVNRIFELADKLSDGHRVIEEHHKIDVLRIHDLIRSHEECQDAKKVLDLQLTGLNQELEVLMSTEEQIIEAEQKARQLRQEYELAKSHLEEKIICLRNSTEQQNKLNEELWRARIEAEDELLGFERLKSSYKAQEAEFQWLVNSLKSFGEAPKQ